MADFRINFLNGCTRTVASEAAARALIAARGYRRARIERHEGRGVWTPVRRDEEAERIALLLFAVVKLALRGSP